MRLSVKCPEHYDLLSSVHAWIFPDIQPVPEQTGNGYMKRTFTIDDKSVPIIIKQKSPGDKIEVFCNDPSLDPVEVRKKLDQILNLRMDLNSLHTTIANDDEISFILPAIRGLRPYLADTLFEALIKSVLQQQISYRAANVITRRLILALRTATDDIFSFPNANQILSLGEEGLKKLGIGYKTDYVRGVCKQVSEGTLNLEQSAELGFELFAKTLNPIKGVGKWTIEVLAIAGLGDYSIYPYGDLGIQNLLGRIYNDGCRLRRNEVIEISQRWGEQGPLVLYMLMCADVLGFMNVFGRSMYR